MVCFIYDDEQFKSIQRFAEQLPNFALYGPTGAVIGARALSWDTKEMEKDTISTFWDRNDKNPDGYFTLGDFNILGAYLLEISGRKKEIESEIKQLIEESTPNPLSGIESSDDEK